MSRRRRRWPVPPPNPNAEEALRRLEETGQSQYIPATPEQREAYEAELRKDIVGYPRVLQYRGELTKEQADEQVRRARIERELQRRRKR